MTPYYSDESVTLYGADCLEVLAALDADSVDAVVTDPPYGLGFMGKAWDSPGGTGDFPMRRFDAINTVNTGASRQGGRQRSTADFQKRQARDARSYQAWCEKWASECLRVLKPGGHLLAFGGTRTAHRLASAIEDAGFEIRDTIAWLYGSGFPKSLDVSKALDKREGIWRDKAGEFDTPNGSMAGPNYERTDKGEPVSAAAAGWGTALKPANEPIIVARKSLSGTVADNWLQHGTGALNIDACRVQGEREAENYTVTRWKPGARLNAEGGTWKREEQDAPTVSGTMPGARWPTNVVLDEAAAAELDRQVGTLTSGANPTRRSSDKFRTAYGDFAGQEECNAARGADSGGPSRFFPTFRYEAKAPTSERPEVNGVLHPTVKPLDLMRWLVRLVTQPGGVVLEPFAGSGTTAEACVIEGFRCIAIEREPDYLPLIVARLTKPLEPVLDFGAAS